MQPEQLVAPTGPQPPPGHYDFILAPKPQPKRTILGGVSGNSFIVKILFIVVAALLLMAVMGIGTNLLFGGKTDLNAVVSIAQTEQEIARLGDQGGQADDQLVKNAAVNTDLNIRSHQTSWIAFLSKHGRKVESKELNLKKDTSIDDKLKLAKQSSTFDATYTEIMRGKLTEYAASLKTAFEHSTSKTERKLLSEQYADTNLLLKQWPN